MMSPLATGLSAVPLALVGSWASPQREMWRATVACDQPVVCVRFQICEGLAHWTKSSRLEADSEAIRISIGIDPSDPRRATVGCGWIAEPTQLAAAGARPALPQQAALKTGTIWPLGRFDSDPAIEFYLLFLAAPDFQFGRNRLWRVDPARAAAIAESCRLVLAGGRSGTCAWPLLGLKPE